MTRKPGSLPDVCRQLTAIVVILSSHYSLDSAVLTARRPSIFGIRALLTERLMLRARDNCDVEAHTYISIDHGYQGRDNHHTLSNRANNAVTSSAVPGANKLCPSQVPSLIQAQ
ncbi:hypothetical protein J3458_003468 [Metarhizium acridum]|uniref:uncharacterized protein n=1 Tax=Metarhizium acridum TaxID=92637 RepID=UPI001C6CC04C|nr:hypothetical protein J3458_003468 [Metarhizium acridum]